VNNISTVTLCALLLPCCIAPQFSSAADVNYSADLASRLRHQKNVAISLDNPIDVDATEVSVNMRLWRKTEVRNSVITLNIKDDHYEDYSEFEQDFRTVSLEHRFKQELTQYSIHADINKSTTLGNSFESGEFVRRNVPVLTRSINGSAVRYFNEAISGSLESTVSDTRYKQSLDVNNQDYDDKQYVVSGRYQDSEVTDWQLSSYVDEMDQLQSGMQVVTTGFYVLRTYQWDEIWSLSGKYGRRKTHMEGTNFFGQHFEKNNFGRVASLDIKRKGQLGTLGVSASQDISPRANGIIDDSKRLGASWQTKTSERTNLNLNISRVNRKPLNTVFIAEDATQNDTYSASVGYAWSEDLSLDVSARWVTRTFQSAVNNPSADSGTVSAGLRWHLYP
jgi:hypothetical protein